MKGLLIFSLIFLTQLNQTSAATYPFLKGINTKIKDPFEVRDPFKRKLFKSKTTQRKGGQLLKDGKYSNLPQINGEVSSRNIKVVGVLLGKDRRAMVKIDGPSGEKSEIFILKEGMKIGQDNAEVKGILPGGIVLVEKIVNVYDQVEYLETVIPVSSD